MMTAMAIITAPPTAPPMIAAVFELFFLDPESPDLGDDVPVGNGVVKAGKFVGLPVFVPVGPGPEAEEFVPINAPGPISGVPPMAIASIESQRARSWRVTSARAH